MKNADERGSLGEEKFVKKPETAGEKGEGKRTG